MKKILLIVLAVLVAAGLVTFMVIKQQSGYTKVLYRDDRAAGSVHRGQRHRPDQAQDLRQRGRHRLGPHHPPLCQRGRPREEGRDRGHHRKRAAGGHGQRPAGRHRRRQDRHRSYVAAEKTAQANIEHAKADLEQKKLDWDRAQALYKAGIMAKQDYDAKKAAYDLDVASVAQAVAGLNQAKAQTESARGHMQTAGGQPARRSGPARPDHRLAPFDGIVTNEPVREGETVVEGIQNTEGSTLMTLADMSVVTAEVKVDETDIVNVQLGQPADVTVDALPGKVFKGHVTLVGDQALLRSTGIATSQSTTGTEEAKDFKVVVTLDNPSDELRPGLSSTAKITTAHKTNVLALPIQALTMHDPATDNKKAVAASRRPPVRPHRKPSQTPCRASLSSEKDAHGRLRAKFVPVTTGITGATDIEVLSGLNPGEEIVTGPYKISARPQGRRAAQARHGEAGIHYEQRKLRTSREQC